MTKKKMINNVKKMINLIKQFIFKSTLKKYIKEKKDFRKYYF